MEATARFHDRVTDPVLAEADFVFHHPIAFHPTKGVFNTASHRRDPAIGGVLQRREFTPTGFFLGLDDGDPSQDEPLDAHLLGETTPQRPGLARQLREAFLLGFAFIGRTQEAHVTALLDHDQVFERVALLLATLVFLLCLGIGRAVDRALSPIRPTRGDVSPSFDWVAVRRVANASAVRAGSRSWCANA
jgi:hypothetical protein